MERRRFIQQTGIALGAAVAFQYSGCSAPKAKRAWGIQLFSIPQMVANDFGGTMKTLQEFGYREIEFFGPYEFSAPATVERWKPLAEQMGIKQNAFYGKSLEEVKKMLDDNNLTTPSAHMDMETMRTNMGPSMKSLSQLGVRYVVIPALMTEKRDTIDDYKRLADEFNGFGKQMKEFGISFVYHNHGYEHSPKDGEIPMDVLLANTDAEVVKFELDIFWMQAAGASPVEYLKKYPGRFKLMHVKDAAETVRFSGDGGTPEQWMELFPKMADPGAGVFNIKEIVDAAIQSGTEHFYLERDLAPKPMETLKNSIEYLRTI
jgi:sugar phosphate isomerase/epimerase